MCVCKGALWAQWYEASTLHVNVHYKHYFTLQNMAPAWHAMAAAMAAEVQTRVLFHDHLHLCRWSLWSQAQRSISLPAPLHQIIRSSFPTMSWVDQQHANAFESIHAHPHYHRYEHFINSIKSWCFISFINFHIQIQILLSHIHAYIYTQSLVIWYIYIYIYAHIQISCVYIFSVLLEKLIRISFDERRLMQRKKTFICRGVNLNGRTQHRIKRKYSAEI